MSASQAELDARAHRIVEHLRRLGGEERPLRPSELATDDCPILGRRQWSEAWQHQIKTALQRAVRMGLVVEVKDGRRPVRYQAVTHIDTDDNRVELVTNGADQ